MPSGSTRRRRVVAVGVLAVLLGGSIFVRIAVHRADGAAYRFVADAIVRLDAINPQVAARVVTAFGPWRSFEPIRRALMRHELERLAARRESSPDLADLVGRALA